MSQDKTERPPAATESIDSLLRAVAHEPPVAVAPAHEFSLLEPTPLPRVGEVLGKRYRIDALLGAGGMGAVFAARHLKTDKEVAIKVLLPRHGLSSFPAERITRFVREAQAAGRIHHPNVVDVYDVEESGGLPYLVMERLYGESLWQRMRREKLTPDEVIPILLAAMRGVAEAHRQGVIHRDLKPDNIFLARAHDGDKPVPKVLDFGVSRIVAREDSEDPNPTTLTRTGYVLGTPAYMPLEQLRGGRDVDARADVYALGVILYEALCGERPYNAPNDHELVIRMVTERPVPLRQRRPELDAHLDALVMKALAREPEGRFADVDSFARALERWLSGDPIPMTPEPLKAVTRSAIRRTLPFRFARARWVWVAAAVVLGALALLIGRNMAPPVRVLKVAGKEAKPAALLPQGPVAVDPPAAQDLAAPLMSKDPPPIPSPPRRREKSPAPRASTREAPRADPATDVTLEDF